MVNGMDELVAATDLKGGGGVVRGLHSERHYPTVCKAYYSLV